MMPSLSGNWNRLAYLHAVIVSATIGYFLFHVPFEVTDNLGNLLQLQISPSASRMLVDAIPTAHGGGSAGFLRPVSWATTKLVFDLSSGHYFVVYRSLHVVMVFLLMVLFMRLVKVDSALTFGVAVVSSCALIGMHTFREVVRETELNIKLILPVCCFAAVSVSMSKPAYWKDVVAFLLLLWGVFANELGILIWVCLAAGYLLGFRGVSRYAIVAATVLLGLYFYLRFVQWNVGTPSLAERSSGFGFRVLDPPELVRLFGDNPYPFYLYNVMASILGVLFSEPSSGAFAFVRDYLTSKLTLGMIVNVVSSTVTTAMLMWFVIRRWRRWVTRDFDEGDKLFLFFVAVLFGNAAISFPYIKDITLSTAGTFYALGMFVALRSVTSEVADRSYTAWRSLLVCVALSIVSIGWTTRAVSFYMDMRQSAFKAQSDWAGVYEWLDEQRISLRTPEQKQLVEQLRSEMMAMKVPKLYLQPEWVRALDSTR